MSLADDLPPPPDPPRAATWHLMSTKENSRGCREVLAVCDDIKTDNSDMEKRSRACCCGIGLRRVARDLGLHGVRRMAAGDKSAFTVRKVLWLVILLASLASFAYQSVDCITYYLARPVVTSFVIRPQPALALPAMTICNANPLRLSDVYRRGWLSWLQRLARNQAIQGDQNLTSRAVFASSGHKLEDMLMGCWSTQGQCSRSVFSKVLTEAGTCYTANLTDRNTKLVLNPELYEAFDFMDSTSGFKVLFHAVDEFPAAMDNAILVAPGYHSNIRVAASRVKLILPPEGTCSRSAHSVAECEAACKGRHILRECGCQPFWMSVEENAIICTMARYILCALKVKAPSCYCDAPCIQHHYDGFTSMTHLSSRTISLLRTNLTTQESVLKVRHAHDIAARYTPHILEQDTNLCQRVITSFNNMVTAFQNFNTALLQAGSTLETHVQGLIPRVNFHLHNVLGGVKRSLEHGFIDAWDAFESRYLNPMVSDYNDTIAKFDRSLKNIEFTPISNTTKRNVIYFMMDSELSGKLEMAIQAVENLRSVYEAFVGVRAVGSYSVTPGGRYDDVLVPRDILMHTAEAQTEYYSGISENIAGYMTDLLKLKYILKDVNLSNNINESARNAAKNSFAEHSRQLNHYLSLFRNRVIAKSQEEIESKIERFRKLNHSFISYSEKIKQEITTRNQTHRSQYAGTYRAIVPFVQETQKFIDRASMKAELASKGLAQGTEHAVSDILRIHNDMLSRAQNFAEMFRKCHEAMDVIWSSFLSDQTAQNFSTKLHEDVNRLRDRPSSSAHMREIFTHLLNIGRDEARSIPPSRFIALLNADIAVLGRSTIRTLERTFEGMKNSTDVSIVIGDKVQVFERNYTILKENLIRFMSESSIDDAYIRNNLIEVNIQVSESGTSELSEMPGYTLTSLLGDIGGLLALFLGASAITIFELLDILFSSCHICRNNNTDEEKQPAVRKSHSYGAPFIHYSSVSQHPPEHFHQQNHVHLKRDSPAMTHSSPTDRYQSGNGFNQTSDSPSRYSNKDLRQGHHRVHFANTDI